MSHESQNFVTHNPFEGKNGAVTENDLRFSLQGIMVSTVFFILMFAIAVIIEFVA